MRLDASERKLNNKVDRNSFSDSFFSRFPPFELLWLVHRHFYLTLPLPLESNFRWVNEGNFIYFVAQRYWLLERRFLLSFVTIYVGSVQNVKSEPHSTLLSTNIKCTSLSGCGIEIITIRAHCMYWTNKALSRL